VEKFTTLYGTAAPMMVPNVDTDAIMPVEQMKTLDINFANCLFFNHRYRADGSDNPDFVLNRPPYRDAKILVAGANFGCGSSREHAVWALMAYGIRCVIAPSFGDIFYNNSFKNGLLAVRLPADSVGALAASIEADTDAARPPLHVDLEACTIRDPDGRNIGFEIEPARGRALLMGLDPIGVTLEYATQIAAFQANDGAQRPWIYQNGFRVGAR
jgi:3-isopropylmalate/(R)-2-methylmalate dehydratase small subunit